MDINYGYFDIDILPIKLQIIKISKWRRFSQLLR